jgi:hypothetical protein
LYVAGGLLLVGRGYLRAPKMPIAMWWSPQVGAFVDKVQKLTGEFKNSFDKAVSHSMIDGTRLEANAKHRADDLHDTANRLGDVFHDKRDKNNPAVRDQADKTIAVASELNHVMLNHRFTDRVERDWDMPT